MLIERLGRSLKYEDVYLTGRLSDGLRRWPLGRTGIAACIRFYNGGRSHEAPMAAWREGVIGSLAGKAVDMTTPGMLAAGVHFNPSQTS